MKIQRKDVYYGIALAQVAEYPTFTSINKVMEKEGVYLINGSKQLLIKYATKKNDGGEWRFTFRKGELASLSVFDSFVALVCAQDTICLLPLDSITEIINEHSKSAQWVSVHYPSGGQMRVRGSKGALSNAIAHNDFPMKIFENVTNQQEGFLWPRFSTLNFYRRPPELIFSTHDRRLDLSDSLTANVTMKRKVTLYFGISTISNDWKIWSESNLKKIEGLIRYDLEFDGFKVDIERVCKKKNLPCDIEFLWKLTIGVKLQ